MVRTVEKKYQIWLAGYYDDFNGARAIADDRNQPTDSSYSALKSHFGNPMNGEAFINPRFRFSIEERLQDSAKQIATPAPTGNQYLQNDGIFEWLSLDDTRLNFSHWEGRAQLQYPDGHIANRYKFDNDSTYGSDFYQRFINGHNSDASYIVPVGDNDATFGHANMKDYDTTNYNAGDAGLHSTTGNFVQRAHLTGVWMGEEIDHDHTNTTPNNVYQELHSPSKQPFLCIQTTRKATTDSPTTPTLIYDGPLNTRLDGDIFTARVALQNMSASSSWVPGIEFKIGFSSSQAGILNDSGYTGTPAIDYTLDLSTVSGYNTSAFLTGASAYNTPSMTNDNAWIDVDFVFDYTANTFDVYVNGSSVATNQTMSGGSATTASDLYGYQILVTNETGAGSLGYVSYLMIDRVGLVRYLTDDFTTTEEVQIQNLQVKQNVNGMSVCNVKVADDPALTGGVRGAASSDYLLNLRGLFVSSTPLDWSLLVFADSSARIDRPVWRGEIDNFSITQTKNRSRILAFDAKDSIMTLDRQIPLWDVGQNGENTTEDTTDYWRYDAQGYRDIMNLGVGKLKLLSGDVGFDSDSSYKESATQRTQLGSGHPIQMYNNEDATFGPNSIESEYESYGIIGFAEAVGTTGYTIAIADGTTHGISASDTVTVIGENYNEVSATVHSVSGAEIKFTSAQLTYYPETAKIIYIGKYPAFDYTHEFFDDSTAFKRNEWNLILLTHPSSTDFTPSGPTYMNVYFNADPNLSSGDYFYINRRDEAGTSNLDTAYHGRHRVSHIKKIRSYFDSFGTTTSSSIWVVKTDTPYGGSESFGDYENDALLTASSTPQRFSWSKETGRFADTFGTNAEDMKYRAIHALWMRDLPYSLWFKYHFGVVKEDALNKSVEETSYISSGQTIDSSDKYIQISQTAYDNAPNSGVAEIWSSVNLITGAASAFVGKFIFQGKVTDSGNYYLVGCKHINFSVSTTSNSHIIKYQDFKDDYKHLWLLWSDMRNNGNADADGETRKSEFGLQYPIDSNYKFELFYADQTDADGNIDKFANLKVGEDLDVWNVDATSDPVSNIPLSKPADNSQPVSATIGVSGGFLTITVGASDMSKFGDYVHLAGTTSHDGGHTITSKTSTVITTATTHTASTYQIGSAAVAYPTTGSENEAPSAVYEDWEDKAGALLVLDTAKFFNLNTHINSGKTGQTAGGSTDLSDYVATLEGHPALIDNYWAEAISSYKTTNLDGVLHHPAQRRLLNDVTLATDGFVDGYIGLPVNDTSIFEDSGAGKLIAVMNRNNNESNTPTHYFVWNGKLDTEYSSSSGIDSPLTFTTYEGQSVIHITNSGETHEASGIKKGMVLKRTPSGGGDVTIHNILAVGDTSGSNTDTDLVIQRNAVDGSSVTWSSGDTYTIPKQLALVYSVPLSNITDNASVTASQSLTSLEDAIWEDYNNRQVSWNNYGINMALTTSGDEATPTTYEVHATVYSNYMLRLLMHINGFYENKNGGSYWDNDKLRLLWNAAIMDTWLPSAKVNSIFDINNVPITNIMTTYNDTGSNDTYGSMVDSRGKTLGATIQQIQQKSGYGSTNSNYTAFSYLVGRDNRFEFRPKYNNGLTLDRNNISISSIKSNMSGQITNVRVYYNNGNAFVDWPATNLSDSTRWKIVEHPKTTHSGEALLLAQQEYNKRKNNPLQLTVTPILESGVSHKMIESGRYGYVADPTIALHGASAGNDAANVCNWTVLATGGCLFPGMVNALNGNMNTDIDPLETRYGQSQNTTSSGDVAWADNYYWYGSNSISHAVQVVHVPNETPLTNSDGFSMRMWVDLKNQTGTSIDDAEFVITLADYSFTGLDRTASSNGTSTKDVKHSGYYEIDIPSSYDSGSKKLIISFNAEYCRALLRHRCGDPTQTNSGLSDYILDSSVDNGSGNVNADSIFPLGKRPYTEMGGGFRNQRLIWYAPRVQICRDLSYVPATYASVTDAGLQLSSENMVIKNVDWNVKAGATEEVTLTMERDESLTVGGVMSYLFPTTTGTNQIGSTQNNGTTDTRPTIDSLIPPSNSSSSITDPSSQSASGGTSQRTDAWDNKILNGMEQFDSQTYGRFRGRMDLPTDDNSGNATHSILGQRRPAVTPSVMRGIEGMDVDIRATSGTASITASGYTFGGKGLMGGESVAASQETNIETTFVVPRDVLTNRINIQATVTHSPLVATDKTAVLYITILIEETGETLTETIRIGTGINQKIISLVPTKPLAGIKAAGNHIKITITRKPGVGDDDADTTSVTLHNLDVKMQRAVAHSRSLSSEFSTNS